MSEQLKIITNVKDIFEIGDDIIELLLKENAQDNKVMFALVKLKWTTDGV